MAEFPLSLTATEIDAALGKAHAPDTTLTGTLGSDPSLATAGAIRTALDNLPILTADTATTGITDSEFHGPTSAGLLDHLAYVHPKQALNAETLTATFAGKSNSSADYRRNTGLRLGAITGASNSLVGEIASNTSSTNTEFSVTLKEGGIYDFTLVFIIQGDNFTQFRKGSKIIINTAVNTTSQVTMRSNKFVSDIDQTVNFTIFQNTTNSYESARILSGAAIGGNRLTIIRYGVGSLESL